MARRRGCQVLVAVQHLRFVEERPQLAVGKAPVARIDEVDRGGGAAREGDPPRPVHAHQALVCERRGDRLALLRAGEDVEVAPVGRR